MTQTAQSPDAKAPCTIAAFLASAASTFSRPAPRFDGRALGDRLTPPIVFERIRF